MSKQLLLDARELRKKKIQEQIDIEEQTLTREAEKIATAEKVILENILDLPVFLDLLKTQLGVYENIEDEYLKKGIVSWSSGVSFWQDDVGDRDYPLMQKEECEDHGGEPLFVTYVYGMKFTNIFGHDIYLVPKISLKGVACIVVNKRNEKRVFLNDIPYDVAVDMVSETI